MKKRGHYCIICGEIKANEKFSGYGHKHHICKICMKIPAENRLEILHMSTISELPDTRKGRRQLHLFMTKKKFTDRVKAYAREHLKLLEELRCSESMYDDEYNECDEVDHDYDEYYLKLGWYFDKDESIIGLDDDLPF